MKIQWSPDYELGIGVIDLQHRRIVDYINEVHDITSAQRSRLEIEIVLHHLVDYTFSHFAFEESLLEESGYEQLAQHQESHREFEAKIQQMYDRYKEGEDIATELADMLTHWLLAHIANDDKSYSALVKETFLKHSPETHSNWVSRATRRFFN